MGENQCPPNAMGYQVQEEDTFFTIAKKFEVSLDELAALNVHLEDPSAICPGETIFVPAGDKQQCPPDATAYTVQPGDTFFTIAKKYDISLDVLIEANPQIEDPSYIQPGDILCIPETPVECPQGAERYTVQPGDSLFTIARTFQVSLDNLIAANPHIKDPGEIQPGMIVCIPLNP